MTEPAAGATPGSGATPGQPGQSTEPPAAPPATPPTPPATGAADDQLGDAGKRAIEAERKAAREALARAEKAEKERDELRAATQSDQDKAIEAAKKEAQQATAASFESKIRRAEARAALRAAGITNEKTLDLAATAPEFSTLKVTEDGSVDGLDTVVESFRKDHPEMFAKAPGAPTPPVNRGAGPNGAPDAPKSLEDAIAARYAQHPTA